MTQRESIQEVKAAGGKIEFDGRTMRSSQRNDRVKTTG